MKYSIFAHQSLYHLKEEIDNATGEDIDACDWQTLEYTLKQWPIALKDMQPDFGYICIMDRSFKVIQQWIRKDS